MRSAGRASTDAQLSQLVQSEDSAFALKLKLVIRDAGYGRGRLNRGSCCEVRNRRASSADYRGAVHEVPERRNAVNCSEDDGGWLRRRRLASLRCRTSSQEP